MRVQDGTARAHCAPGRLRLYLSVGLLATIGGCAGGGSSVEPAGPPALPDPVVMRGRVSAGEDAQAAALFRAAREAYGEGRFPEATELARAAVDRFPSAGVSGRALRLQAEAALAAEMWPDAAAAAARYAALLAPDDPRRPDVMLVKAQAHLGAGEAARALALTLSLPADADAELLRGGRDIARAAAAALPAGTLVSLLERATPGNPAVPVVQARLAQRLREAFEDDDARAAAEAALEAGAVGPDAEMARTVLDAPPLPRARSVRIAAVLPLSGSPALRSFARQIAEGIEVAAATAGEDLLVEVRSVDNQGDTEETVRAVRALMDGSVLGAVGFLEDVALEAGGQARSGPLALISPSARSERAAGEGAYSLAGADPAGARAIAGYAATRGYTRAAILHTTTPGSSEEADAFAEALRDGGIPLVGRFTYAAGTTFFQDQIRAAREALRLGDAGALPASSRIGDTIQAAELPPVALFVPIPAEDVEFVAPQLTFFGLDTLAIEVLGTSGWTETEVLNTVDSRHTNGVVATAPWGAGVGSPGFRAFRSAYEAHFRRSLVSTVPALGYDAVLVLLQAIRSGADTPARVVRALERIEAVQGATGVFSVEGSRIVRRPEVVRILGRTTVPIR